MRISRSPSLYEVLVKSLDLVMLGEAIFPGAILDLLREQDIRADQSKASTGCRTSLRS